MNITYGQLFQFMGTFTNQQLDDAQVIAENLHEHFGKSYNQFLFDILVEIRKEQLADSWSVQAGGQVQTLSQLLPPAEMGTAQQE